MRARARSQRARRPPARCAAQRAGTLRACRSKSKICSLKNIVHLCPGAAPSLLALPASVPAARYSLLTHGLPYPERNSTLDALIICAATTAAAAAAAAAAVAPIAATAAAAAIAATTLRT